MYGIDPLWGSYSCSHASQPATQPTAVAVRRHPELRLAALRRRLGKGGRAANSARAGATPAAYPRVNPQGDHGFAVFAE